MNNVIKLCPSPNVSQGFCPKCEGDLWRLGVDSEFEVIYAECANEECDCIIEFVDADL